MQQESWLLTNSTRSCPDCLTGDDSIIQQRHGGPWRRHWRLPVVFACVQHRRLLEHRCPACRQPIHARTANRLLPQMLLSLHSTHCRAIAAPAVGRREPVLCGTRLQHTDQDTVRGTEPSRRLLDLQDRILDLLHTTGPATTLSLGHHVTATGYLIDLRILAGLISASWPAALDVAEHPPLVSILDTHLRQRHREIAQRRQHRSRPCETTLHNQPPLPADACAALLALADNIIAQTDPDAGRQALAHLAAQAPLGSAWAKRVTTTSTHRVSPGLALALQPVLHRWQPAGRRVVRHPPGEIRAAAFDHRHIPQRLPDDWYQPHFGHLTGANHMLLNRLAAIKLVRLVDGGTLQQAARLLGNPDPRVWSTIADLEPWFQQPAHAAAFDTALGALADQLDTSSNLINYGRRRDALANWSIPPDDWNTLTADLVAAERPRSAQYPPTGWDDQKRRLASIIVWTHLTHSEFRFAPLLPVRQRDLRRDLQHQWGRYHGRRPYRHHIHLKTRLDTYMTDLAQRIDGIPAGPLSGDASDDHDPLSGPSSTRSR